MEISKKEGDLLCISKSWNYKENFGRKGVKKVCLMWSCGYSRYNQMQDSHYYKYAIIGGGISALQAALILAEHGQSFIILEASQRIGGRICSLTLGDATNDCPGCDFEWLEKAASCPVECGATWICQDHSFMLNFVKEFGLNLTEQYYQGQHILAESPSKYHHVGKLGDYYMQFAPQIKKLIASLQHLRHKFEDLTHKQREQRITSEEEEELKAFYDKYDNISAYDYIKKQVGDEYLSDLLAKETATLQCCHPREYSVLQLFEDGEEPFANVKFYIGLQDANIDGFRLREGMLRICQHLKQATQRVFDKQGEGKNIDALIKLNTPVAEIKNSIQPVQVITESGDIYTCEKAIMCLPAATFHRIKYQTLTQSKRLLTDNQVLCNMTRMAMVFKEPFWRKRHAGYVSFSHNFPMNEVVELTPDSKHYAILAFVFTAEGFSQWNKSVLEGCKTQPGEEGHQSEWYQINKSKAMRIIADLYLEGDVESPHLKQVAIFYRSLSASPYIKSTYQSVTAKSTAFKISQTGEVLPEGSGGDELNMVVLGSDFSDEFCGYMEGAVRLARRKIYSLCGTKDPLEHLGAIKSFQGTLTID